MCHLAKLCTEEVLLQTTVFLVASVALSHDLSIWNMFELGGTELTQNGILSRACRQNRSRNFCATFET